MSRTVLLPACLLALSVLLSPSVASATSALFVSDGEQARLSTAVAVVEVGAAEVGRHPRWQRIITRTTLKVTDLLAGHAPEQVVIEQFGGTLDGEVLYIPGDARFEKGERCVVFLREVDGGWYLTAMEQSKYHLVDSHHGPVLERRLSEGVMVQGPSGSLRPYSEPPTKPLKTLKDFRRTVGQVLSAPEGRP